MSADGRLTHDLRQGRAWRDEALANVEAHAPEDWKERALDAVYHTARQEGSFTADDVWLRLDADDRPHEPRAMGAVMMRAKRLGIVAPTGEFVACRQKSCHAAPVRVWRYILDGPYGAVRA